MLLFKYELRNALRSKWLYTYAALLFATCCGLIYIVDDFRKAIISLSSVLLVIVPLVSILFTVSYWYSAEAFTTTLLSQPVSRCRVYFARVCALIVALIASVICGVAIPALLFGINDSSLLWLLSISSAAAAVFCMLGTCGLIRHYARNLTWT